MAIYQVGFTFQDEQGRTTERGLLVDEADEAAALAAIAAMVTVLEGFSKCAISKYWYRRETVLAPAPGLGSNVDPGATFSWTSGLAIDPTSQLPDPEEAVKDGQGGIDLANALVTAYVNSYLAGNWRLNRNVPTQPLSVKRATVDK